MSDRKPPYMDEQRILADAEALANMQHEAPTEEEFCAAEAVVREHVAQTGRHMFEDVAPAGKDSSSAGEAS